MLQDDNYSPVISLLIDDKPRKFLLDTGGFWSMVSPEVSAGYKARRAAVSARLGLQGVPLDKSVVISSIQLGPVKWTGVEFYLSPPGYWNFDGTLGANWLKNFDVEIDPVSNTASLFSHDHCEGQVVHWPHQDLAVVPFKFDVSGFHITLPLMLDGKQVSAMVDTGAPETVLSLRAAKRLFDLTPDSPGMQVIHSETDKFGNTHSVFRYQFPSLEMGDIAFKNTWLIIAEVADSDQDMILGMHQLHGLHLFFAYKERKLYITTARGDIAAGAQANGQQGRQDAPQADPLARINAKNYKEAALAALRKKDVNGAMDQIDKAIQIDPGYADAYLMRAGLHVAKGERDQAQKDCDQALHADPNNMDVYIQRSQIEWAIGDKSRALTDVNLALQRDPASTAGYQTRARFEALSDQRDKAIADASEAVRIAPNSEDYSARAQIYALFGDYAHAYEDQTTVVKFEPKSQGALNNRCWFGAILGKLDDALDDCDAALRIAPHDSAAFDSRGFVRLKREQWERAITDYSAALEITPNMASSLYGRALAKQHKGDKSGADADMAAAQKIDPDIERHFGK